MITFFFLAPDYQFIKTRLFTTFDYFMDWTPVNLLLIDLAVVCITWTILRIMDCMIGWKWFTGVSGHHGWSKPGYWI